MNIPEELLSFLAPESGNDFLVDLLRREVWITGAINPGISRPIVRGLRQLARLSEAPITVFVNTEGGDPFEAMVIADFMRELNKRMIVGTSVVNCSYSAGVLISAAGKKGHRSAVPSADFLIHQLSVGGIAGKIEDVEATTVSLKRLNSRIARYLSEVTGESIEAIVSLMRKESYLGPKKALKLGLIDRIHVPV